MIPPLRKRFCGPANHNGFTAATGEVAEIASDPPGPESDWKNRGQAESADRGNSLPRLGSMLPDDFCDYGDQRESGQRRVTNFCEITRSDGQSGRRCERK